ncbi:MAG TPA: hypothetical protein VHK69_09890 [Chitinophagaceae bacterium]|nr:hypothetical protein [Chitinophagaceae bacterium]
MNIVKRCFLTATAAFALYGAQAQTADELINKHIEAIGGKEKLSAINAVRMTSTVQVMGNEAPSTTTVVNGKGYRSESEFGGQKMVQVVTDKGGWAINPFAGGEDPQPMPEEQYKASQANIYVVPFLNYAANGYKVELQGQEKVGEVNAFKLKMTSKDNVAATYYIDPATFYIVQMVQTGDMMGQPVEIRAKFSDYKKTDYGFVVPHTVDMNLGDQLSLTTTITKVEVNPQVDAALFEMKK